MLVHLSFKELIEYPRCMILAPMSGNNRMTGSIVAMLRTVTSRVISCHSRDIGVACLYLCWNHKDGRAGWYV